MQLRWGIVGCGRISGDFVQAVKLLSSAEQMVVAVAASEQSRAEEFRATQGIPQARAYATYQDLFQDSNVGAVYVGNLNHQHVETVKGALAAGKHVLCEKPLGVNAAQVREMKAAAETAGCFLMEGYWTRFFPVYKRVLAAVREGQIGSLRAVIANFGYSGHGENKFRRDGGGCLLATGCYLPMLVSSIFWPERPEKISAAGNLRNGVDESGTLTMLYSGGRLASLCWSAAADLPNTVDIVGDKATISIPETWWCPTWASVGGERMTEALPGPQTPFQFPNGSGMAYEAAAVREALMDGKLEHPLMPLEESLHLAEILDETRRQLGFAFPQDH